MVWIQRRYHRTLYQWKSERTRSRRIGRKVKDLGLIDNDDDQEIILFAENNDDTVLVENAKTVEL